MRCQKFEFVSLSTDMFISTILRVSYMRKHNLFNLTVLNSIVQRFSRLYLKRVAGRKRSMLLYSERSNLYEKENGGLF